jgi:hypothetical protein
MVLSSVGLQLPVIPFKDVVGKGANGSPAQIASIGVKSGVINASGCTVIVNLSSGEQGCKMELGVNVYSVVMVLFRAGLHVPVIPFKDVVGKGANVSPIQMSSIGAKSGVTIGFTTMVSV